MAWIRTALSLIGFGVGIGKLSDYLDAHRDVTPFAYRGTAAARPATFSTTP